MNDTQKSLEKLLRVFSADKIVSPEDIKEVVAAIIKIMAEHKKSYDTVSEDAKGQLQQNLQMLSTEHGKSLATLQKDVTKTKAEIEKLTKETNDRAFKKLQTLIAKVKLPKDGKDSDPEMVANLVLAKIKLPEYKEFILTPEQTRDSLETLEDDERLDAKAIKGLERYLERYFGKVYKKGKDMLVGGIRFFENLADVSIVVTKKRQGLLAQYNTTNNRWQDGVALTVSTTQPTSPQENDVWIDTN